MADDWQVGDLALCVNRWCNDDDGLRLGGVYRVSDIDGAPVRGLRFDDLPAPVGRWWYAECFRKIRPHKPDEEDAETIRLLNGERVKEGAQ